ncbi:MAG TPA: carboxypeptidase-like regulatory domain-containing protein [Pyrinomonadaceae bacterium]|nr:carboxypeptidase-like regulatory domain-containing protein [Pyrinomonadaceae bacterium]
MNRRKIICVLILLSAVALDAQHVATQTTAQETRPPAASRRPPQAAPSPVPTPQTPRDVAAPVEGARARGKAGEARGSGSITGRVVGEDGQAIPFVSVIANAVGASRTTAAAAADAEGKFRLDNLDPAAYLVAAYAPGYVTMPDPLVERGTRVYRHLGEFVTVTLMKGGVINGMVTNASGDPVVGMRVRAVFVRDLDGHASGAAPGASYGGERHTDDRGIYRIYGLPSGVYLVVAGGAGQSFSFFPSAFDADSPTYFPSSAREGATEVNVRAGQETQGIDIRHRGEQGHTVGGRIEGVGELGTGPNAGGVSLMLTHVATGTNEFGGFNSARGGDAAEHTFSFEGLADGDYDLTARRTSRDGDLQSSAPRRVSVRGADVSGIVLTMLPLATVGGRVQVESATTPPPQPSGACPEKREALLPQETVVVLRRDMKDIPRDNWRMRQFTRRDTAPDAQGDFVFRGLDAGRFRPEALPANELWYVRALTFPASAAAATGKSVAPAAPPAKANPSAVAPPRVVALAPAKANSADMLTLASGQNVKGLNIQIAYGAATLRGQISADASAEGARPAAASSGAWRVHLVPVERERAEDVLRYAETPASMEGAFAFSNLAPGRYWLVARSVNRTDATETPRPVAWDAEARALLRREAETANIIVDLQPCQRVEGFTLRLTK